LETFYESAFCICLGLGGAALSQFLISRNAFRVSQGRQSWR
jgi:hypothetical protein